MTYQRLISWIYKASNVLVLVLAVRLYFFIDKSKTKTNTKKSYNLQTLKPVHTKATITKWLRDMTHQLKSHNSQTQQSNTTVHKKNLRGQRVEG